MENFPWPIYQVKSISIVATYVTLILPNEIGRATTAPFRAKSLSQGALDIAGLSNTERKNIIFTTETRD